VQGEQDRVGHPGAENSCDDLRGSNRVQFQAHWGLQPGVLRAHDRFAEGWEKSGRAERGENDEEGGERTRERGRVCEEGNERGLVGISFNAKGRRRRRWGGGKETSESGEERGERREESEGGVKEKVKLWRMAGPGLRTTS